MHNRAEKYLNQQQIAEQLKKVEHIVLAAPSQKSDPNHPLHFTIFFNTADVLTDDVQNTLLQKILRQYSITSTCHVKSQLDNVAFVQSVEETPMPIHLKDPHDKAAIEHTVMYVMMFDGDSDAFDRSKEGMTLWKYAYYVR